MKISYEQYLARAQILFDLFAGYIDDRYQRVSSSQDVEETALLTLAIRRPFHDKIAVFLRDVLHCSVSFGEKATDDSSVLLDVCLDTDRFHQANLPYLAAAFEALAMPKYLILDSDAVLSGEVMYPSDEDIVLETYDCGSVRVLKNGYQTLKHLNELTETLGYEMVLYSKYAQKDQVLLLRALQAACTRHEVKCPKVHAMAVCAPTGDKRTSNDSTSSDNTLMIPWREDSLPGNDSLRRALEEALSITTENRHHHIVFEESKLNVSAAIGDGYQVHLLGDSSQERFDTLLEQLVVGTRLKREVVAASITAAPELVSPVAFAPCRFFQAANNGPSLVSASQESSLADDQLGEIQARIGRLEKKIQSCWPYPHKMRKQQKIAALERLIEYCNTMDVEAAVAKIDADFPSIRQGKVHVLIHGLSTPVVPVSM